jgi:hypothetical protein
MELVECPNSLSTVYPGFRKFPEGNFGENLECSIVAATVLAVGDAFLPNNARPQVGKALSGHR